MSNSIVPVHLVVKSMRDNGYKNTAYAVAELIDNSIQHGSNDVHLLCLEDDVQIGNHKTVSRIKEIAILDNGNGMNEEVLQKSLQFGNGTNLDKQSQTGIGKFGMGLPSSSISQAVRVDVWSWQGDATKPLHTYIDVNEIISGELTDVPEPKFKEIPDKWKTIIKEFGKSGTFVLWTKLDRCLWRTGKTIIDHSEYLVGRMYRYFINSQKVKITASVFKASNLKKPQHTKVLLANDPLYLMPNTSISETLVKQGLQDPMFTKWGGEDGYEKKYTISFQGESHDVFVRYSIATEASRKGRNPGSLPHGRQAGGNIGVSILRAGRELDLDTSWTIYDPRERWWGVEVEFPASLDEVFGVTNNKQFANNFKELGGINFKTFLDEREQSISEFKAELLEDDDLKALLVEIAVDIKNQLGRIRETIKQQASRLEKGDPAVRYVDIDDEAEKHATNVTVSRKEQGLVSQSDLEAEQKSDEEKLQEIVAELVEGEVPDATNFAKTIISTSTLYQFVESSFESQAFFSVSPVGGKIIIKLNTSHPAYDQFVEVLNDDIDKEISKADLEKRLLAAKDGMKLLLMAWARFEDEQPDGRLKSNVRNARIDWGRMASAFMIIED
ncbi:ATP-binding protein [Pedobacter psychrotolerans]|uniref:ATP-binding protein n=1 Tax=Pedobacter psychrotolerans TaxID=1843235 RepID=UPI003F9A69DE